MDRIVLAVDREQLRAGLRGGRGHQFPRHHERFLVRKGDPLAGLYRPQRRDEPDRPDRCGNDDLRVRVRGDIHQALRPCGDIG